MGKLSLPLEFNAYEAFRWQLNLRELLDFANTPAYLTKDSSRTKLRSSSSFIFLGTFSTVRGYLN